MNLKWMCLAVPFIACGPGPSVTKACETAVGDDSRLTIDGGTSPESAPQLDFNNFNQLISVESWPLADGARTAYVRFTNAHTSQSQGLLVGLQSNGAVVPVKVTLPPSGTQKKLTIDACKGTIDSFMTLVVPPESTAVFKFGPVTIDFPLERMVLEGIPEDEAR